MILIVFDVVASITTSLLIKLHKPNGLHWNILPRVWFLLFMIAIVQILIQQHQRFMDKKRISLWTISLWANKSVKASMAFQSCYILQFVTFWALNLYSWSYPGNHQKELSLLFLFKLSSREYLALLLFKHAGASWNKYVWAGLNHLFDGRQTDW